MTAWHWTAPDVDRLHLHTIVGRSSCDVGPAQIVDPPFSAGLNVDRSKVITLQMWAV